MSCEMNFRDVAFIPLIGPPDGWPRTVDGHLVMPGMTAYSGPNKKVVERISATHYWCANGWHGELIDLTVEPPVTLESALREAINMIDELMLPSDETAYVLMQRRDAVRANARKALGETT